MKLSTTAADPIQYPMFDLSKIVVAQGGYSIDTTVLPAGLTHIKQGTLIRINSTTRLATPCKTVKVITGGSTSAPRVSKNGLLKVNDILVVEGRPESVTVNAIVTTNADYDVLTLSGAVTGLVANDVLVQESAAESGDSYGGILTDIAAEPMTIKVYDPQFNGAAMVLSQNSGDTLAITYAAKVLTIALAASTGSKNAVATIQTALRALSIIQNVDFSTATVTGTVTPGTGAVLTLKQAEAAQNNSRAASVLPNAMVYETVKNEGTPSVSAIIAAMEIEEVNLPYPVSASQKLALGSKFHFKP